ncbi:MAG: isoprenylcysteine carboxylmethyltransferase family protein [Anaerolineae bacterium]|nr:isoprenylcysteine carboxylmethyltransferase family protein [Anaerolineae bacterium]
MNAQVHMEQPAHHAHTTRRMMRWFVREIMGTVMMAAILFLSAGRVDWMAGWALVVITLLWVIATALVVIPRNPELLAERVGPKKGAKTWDTIIVSSVGILMLVGYVVAGLDIRFGWSTGIAPSTQLVALVVTVLGYALLVWATGANAYFSQIVRIQTERGHTVATGGPYRLVRHPGYVGTILFSLATPLMLGSWWALIPGGISAVLFVVRTALEDRTLQTELAGYADYARRVRYRLMPGLW